MRLQTSGRIGTREALYHLTHIRSLNPSCPQTTKLEVDRRATNDNQSLVIVTVAAYRLLRAVGHCIQGEYVTPDNVY